MFVQKLREITPTAELALIADVKLRQSLLDGYNLKQKSAGLSPNAAPILDLILNYDVNNLEIRSICFSSVEDVMEDAEYIYFAAFDAFPLAIHKKTGRIRELDWGDNTYVIAECAASSAQFLEALILLESTFPGIVIDREYTSEEIDVREKLAEQLAHMAGGNEFKGFYLSVFGL